jgi:hypothetical protein
MKCRSIVGFCLSSGGLGLLAVCLAGLPQAPARAADTRAPAPSHQVVACYFHRTIRCPTCQRIGAYIEEAIQTAFKAEVKAGKVKMLLVDFQDARNQKYAQAYQITAPTLVLMDVHDGKVTSWKAAPKVWSLVGKKADFFSYVQGEVRNYLDVQKTARR